LLTFVNHTTNRNEQKKGGKASIIWTEYFFNIGIEVIC
jgi:hypothetical protein